MVILKKGRKVPQDCACFECQKCGCEWVEDITKITYSEEGFDPHFLCEITNYIMTCPNCEEEVRSRSVKKIVLENLEGED